MATTQGGYHCTSWSKTYELRLREGLPVRSEIDRGVVPGWGPAGRADAWRLGRLAESQEYPLHRGGR